MPRGPKDLHAPIDPKELSRWTLEQVLRLYEEATDHRQHVFHLQELSAGQIITIGPLVPTRSRRWLEMYLTFMVQFDASVDSSINAKLYTNGVASTDICFDLTVGGTAGVGQKSGTVTLTAATPAVSPSNPGKEIVTIDRNTQTPWRVILTAAGGDGNAVVDITLAITYEDFVPFNANRRTLA